jgi:hypothetical protein
MLLKTVLLLFAFFVVSTATFIDPKVEVEHNPNRTASRNFKFNNIPSPKKDDAAAKAILTLIDGPVDGGSAELGALVDGLLPTNEDDPGANVYFRAGSMGGRFRMDLKVRSTLVRSSPTRGIRIRVDHNCINFMQRKVPRLI